jgi:hypothetical protein
MCAWRVQQMAVKGGNRVDEAQGRVGCGDSRVHAVSNQKAELRSHGQGQAIAEAGYKRVLHDTVRLPSAIIRAGSVAPIHL